jgi:hypothetical protein
MINNPINRRVHERFQVNPGYTSMALRRHPDETSFELEGHVYDISEGGVCFELDRPIDPGQTVSIRIDLPLTGEDIGPGRAVFLTGNIVWCDLEEPGASRMAMAVTRFDRAGDRERLIKSLTTGHHLRVA